MLEPALPQIRIFRMISPRGFVNLFWEEWRTGRHRTHEAVFDHLNTEYHSATGKYRYKNFQSFKTLRDHP